MIITSVPLQGLPLYGQDNDVDDADDKSVSYANKNKVSARFNLCMPTSQFELTFLVSLFNNVG